MPFRPQSPRRASSGGLCDREHSNSHTADRFFVVFSPCSQESPTARTTGLDSTRDEIGCSLHVGFMSIPSEQACFPATGTNQDKARICSLFCESGRIPFAVLSRTRPAIPAASSPLSLPTNDLFQSGMPRRWSASLPRHSTSRLRQARAQLPLPLQ